MLLRAPLVILIALLLNADSLRAQASSQPPLTGLAIPTGASRVTLGAEEIRASGAHTLPELLAGRVAGLSVAFGSGIAGTAPRINVRGSTGAVGMPEPLLYVDGMLIREDRYALGSPSSAGVPAFAWEIPVDEIERVEVVLGAAGGATLEFGAARGAVLVTTRRPRTGEPRVTALVETIMPSTSVEFPANYGTPSPEVPDEPEFCTLPAQAMGQCTPSSMQFWNPIAESGLLRATAGTRAALHASGGVVGGAFRTALTAERTATAMADDGFDNLGLSAAYTRVLGARLEIGADARYRRAEGRYAPWSGYLLSAAYGASSDDANGGFMDDPDHTTLNGFDSRQERIAGGANLRWTASDRLKAGVRITVDRSSRRNTQLVPVADAPPGYLLERTAHDAGLGIALDGSYSHRLPATIHGTTEASAAILSSWSGEREDLRVLSGPPAGSTTILSSAPQQTSFAVRERLSFGADRSIAIGARFDRLGKGSEAIDAGVMPTIDASWTVSNESFFPSNDLVPELRLRGALGSSVDHANMFAIALEMLGLNRLERTTESEVGFSAALAGRRLALDVTAFDRKVSNAFVARSFSPSIPLQQAAEWSTKGTDVRLGVAPIRFGGFEWRSTLSASFLRHADADLGTPEFFDIRDPLGHILMSRSEPLGTIADLRYTFSDANLDGIIEPSEVVMDAELSVLGNLQPTRLIGVNTSLRTGGRLSMGAELDGQGGHQRPDMPGYNHCLARRCRALHDPSASLDAQARAVVARYHGSLTGYIQDADFLRLRELWVRVDLSGFLPAAAGRSTELLVTARNVAIWTSYTGGDPESGEVIGPGLVSAPWAAMPLLRSVAVQLRMAW